MKFEFSPTDIEKIRKLNAEGKSMNTIGAEFGCGYGPIQRVYHELGIKPQIVKYNFSDTEIERIRKMVADGMGQREIGAEFGVSQTPITKLLNKLGIKAPPDWSEEDITQLRAMHAAGKSQTEIAETIGFGQSSVSRMYQKLGLTGIDNTVLIPSKIEEIVSLHNDGIKTEEIADRLDLGDTTIRRALDKGGVEISRILTDKEKDQIVELREKGTYIRDIADQMERGVSTILNHLHNVGITGNLPPEPIPTHKICKTCDKDKPIDQFDEVNQLRSDGSYTRRAHCRDCWLLRKTISQSISVQLQKSGSAKNNESCLDYLPYTLTELRQHIESLFDPWMTWDNWGHYNKDDWDDNDQATWVWHIDHIIPHANFKYTSMEDASFRECWALSNLRPYSAKQNVRDNDRGLRLTG